MLDLEGKTMKTVNKAADLVIVNLLFILTSLPIFTMGASAAAMHCVVQRLAGNQEGYAARNYIAAFKENFKKGTILWFLMLPVLLLLGWNVWALTANYRLFPGWIVGIVAVGSLFVLLTAVYIFPLQAYFENGVFHTIKNAAAVMLLNMPKSLLILLVWFVPVIAAAVSYSALAAILFCGFSLPAYAGVFLYKDIFREMEKRQGRSQL